MRCGGYPAIRASYYLQTYSVPPQASDSSGRVPIDCGLGCGVRALTVCSVGPYRREGEGLRLYWDRQREPDFSSRWNPFATDYPFYTFTYHPVRDMNERFTELCEIKNFQEQLIQAAQKALAQRPVPGKANGVVVLNQPILIEAYVGLMSFIGNQNKLGYCLARGNIGF
ncbi:hypothetical protein JZ751_019109 [Albula glossodonta]|uniref:Tumor protein p63 regulated 1 n=1 Tax=Albula glossodonta TaxID=121402 RepID=A0A8T2NNF0_9TELE|nr:hypothetical protein JZ751_019109 [Albula glossodonta]